MHGFVDEIVTDNASYFVSSEFKALLLENGIKQSRILPYWSQNNGLAENFTKSMRKAVRTSLVQDKNWSTKIYTFLLHYRATEHTTTGKAPAQLIYNSQIKTKLPQFDSIKTSTDLRIRDALQKQRIKHYADRSKAKGYIKYKVGQKVLNLKRGKSQMSANWEKQIYQVVSQKGTALKLLSNYGDLVYRNVTHVRPYFETRKRQNGIERK